MSKVYVDSVKHVSDIKIGDLFYFAETMDAEKDYLNKPFIWFNDKGMDKALFLHKPNATFELSIIELYDNIKSGNIVKYDKNTIICLEQE